MKRRLGVIAVFLVLLSGGGSAASANVLGNTMHSSRYWGCVVADDIDLGYCLKNPLPERLPLPE